MGSNTNDSTRGRNLAVNLIYLRFMELILIKNRITLKYLVKSKGTLLST